MAQRPMERTEFWLWITGHLTEEEVVAEVAAVEAVEAVAAVAPVAAGV